MYLYQLLLGGFLSAFVKTSVSHLMSDGILVWFQIGTIKEQINNFITLILGAFNKINTYPTRKLGQIHFVVEVVVIPAPLAYNNLNSAV